MGKKKNVDKPTEDVDESTKGVDKPWDTLMKLVMEKGAQAFASLALPGVQIGDALDKELRVTNIEGDLFLQQAAIRIVAACFPELEQLATKIIKQITDLKQLNKLIIELSTASSQERAKDFL